MRKRHPFAKALLLPALLIGTAHGHPDEAHQLGQELLIVDTHIDVPYRLAEQWDDVTRPTESGDFDLDRAESGGLDVPFMSIYIPAELEESGGAWQLANQLIDSVEAMAARAPSRMGLASSPQDVDRLVDERRMALAMGMENGAPIEGKLENLEYFRDRGISYITLAHSKSNHISDSSYDENRQWGGLSPFGKEVVTEMNRLGMMIDISHLSDDAARQVMEISTAPVIASHSSVRHFTPDWERNMGDDLIKQLADNGGVIQINFGSSFLRHDTREYGTAFYAARDEFMEKSEITDSADPRVTQFSLDYRKESPYPFASIDDVVDHIDYVVKLVGIDHVGLGSDYDGVGDSLPEGLKDVSTYPNLIRELLDRDYSREQISAILGGNVMRVWRQVVATDRS